MGTLQKRIQSYHDPLLKPSLTQEQISLYNQQRKLENRTDLICSAPVKNMYFSRHGKVFVCCHNRDYPIGIYPAQTISEIWKSSAAEKIRKQIANENLSLGCQVCQLDFEKKLFREVKANHFDQLPYHADYPSMMEFELDITCNLECTMCSGEFSSTIRKNREHLPAFQSVYGQGFLEELKEFIPFLSETRFSGGEPFLIPDYIDIWEEIVQINPACLISLQTNGTVLNSRIRKILEKGRFEIGISLDSLEKETFESIRINAKFETVMENIAFFSNYCASKQTAFRLSMCVMRNNWQEMPAYLEFCNQNKAYASFHKVKTPIELGIWNLKSEELHAIYDFLNAYSFESKYEDPISQTNLKHYQNYVAQVKIWAEKQQQEEENLAGWLDLSLEEMKMKLVDRFTVNPSIETELIRKLEDLLQTFPEETQKTLILGLKNIEIQILLQRLKLKTQSENSAELTKLFLKDV